MFKPGDGLYFADSEDEIYALVSMAVEHQETGTAQKVNPYTWDSIAATMLDTLRQICAQ
jgi:hypothetical protein